MSFNIGTEARELVVPVASITSLCVQPGPSDGSPPEESRSLMPHDSATKWQHGMTTAPEHSEHGESPTSAMQEQAYAHTPGRPQRGQPQMQVVIEVQGKEFALGTPTDIQIAKEAAARTT